MRYYEIVMIFNPNYIDKIEQLLNEYSNKIKLNLGNVYRKENLGLKNLCYPIKKFKQAIYILINIGCDINIIKDIEKEIKNNENILRYIILKTKYPISEKSKFFNK